MNFSSMTDYVPLIDIKYMNIITFSHTQTTVIDYEYRL